MSIQGVRIGEKSLSLFLQAATKLQECGGKTDDDNLWSFAIEPMTVRPNAQNTISDSSLESIRRLEAVEDVLHDLLESCERRLRTMKADCQRPVSGHGIQNFPDEVLSGIFEFVVGDDDVPGFLQNSPKYHPHRKLCDSPEMVLTRVCSRFRSVMLNTPVLWSHLNSTMPNKHVSSRLELSRNCLLTIDIDAGSLSKGFQQFVYLITPHAHRWVTFSSELKNYDLVGELEPQLMNLQLPRLESFNADCHYLNTYRSWDMPKLRCVGMAGRFNRRPPSAFSAQTVRSLIINASICNLKMVDYLTSIPNLAELSMVLRDAKLNGVRPLDMFSVHGILPRVRKMSLYSEDKSALRVLIGRIQMPELSNLHLEICCCGAWEMEQMQSFETYPSVKELSISYHRYKGCGAMDLSPLFALFPEMQRLNLLDPCRNFKISEDAKFPPLLSCSALADDGNDMLSLERFVRKLKRNGRWEKLEFFQLEVESSLSRRDAGVFLTKEKLRWHERSPVSVDYYIRHMQPI